MLHYNNNKSKMYKDYAVIRQSVKIVVFARCLRCLKICTANLLMTFKVFSWEICFIRTLRLSLQYLGKVAAFDNKVRSASAPPPPQARQSIFSPNFFLWFRYLSLMETTRLSLSNDIYFVLVYCWVGMLMTLCFCVQHPFWDAKELRSAT